MDLPPNLPSLPDLPSIRRNRRKPKTLIGKIIRAWPWIRLGLRIGRFVLRTRRALAFAAAGLLFTLTARLIRRLRGGKQSEPPPPPPPPSSRPAPGAAADTPPAPAGS